MRTLFHPYLPNGPNGDPALWVDMPDEGHAVLLDLGDLSRIPPRRLLRVDRVIVTHAHIDHFIGFDQLLRLVLRREKELVVSGPPGFLEHVRGKIAAYTWNLIDGYPLRLVAEEVDGDVVRGERYTAGGRMRPEALPDRAFNGTLYTRRAYTAHVTALDHGIPVLGIALEETSHLSVNKDRLERMGLRAGAWLNELKQAVRRRRPGDETIDVTTTDGATRALRVEPLALEILTRTPGQRLVYLSDLRHTPFNVERCLDLARGADLVICETAFLHEDRALARERFHLTARQAGEIARAAGARRLATFHVSPRYHGREQELLDEAADAFGRPVLQLPEGPVL